MKPVISQRYDHDPAHWWFVRDTRLPRDAFARPLRERIIEWAAVLICAVALGLAVALANYYLF